MIEEDKLQEDSNLLVQVPLLTHTSNDSELLLIVLKVIMIGTHERRKQISLVLRDSKIKIFQPSQAPICKRQIG